MIYYLKFTFSAAYKHADGKKIDGKRVLVDVERARTVKGWLPRRLGKLSCALCVVCVVCVAISIIINFLFQQEVDWGERDVVGLR